MSNAPVASARSKRFRGIARLVGNTPLLDIRSRYGGDERRLFAKSEQLNLTGSIKDRMALHIMRRAYAEGQKVKTTIPGTPA